MSGSSAGSAGRRVIVLGGTSEIALACVRELQSREPREVALLGRDREALGLAGEKLRAQGVGRVIELELDALDTQRHEEVIGRAFEELGGGETGVRVLVVRPGFVRTRMTSGLAPAPLATTPEAVAEVVRGGLESGAHTVWAPRALRLPMLLMRMLPRPIFRRIKQ
jgi:short-subunit dehydrogenase